MANQAAKKRAQKSKGYGQGLSLALAVVNGIFALHVVWTWSSFSSSNWNWIGWLGLIISTGMMYNSVMSSARSGVGFEYTFDLFCLTLVVQLGWCYSGYAWLLFLSVPGMAIYKLGKRTSLPIGHYYSMLHVLLFFKYC